MRTCLHCGQGKCAIVWHYFFIFVDPTQVAAALRKKVKLLVWVMTQPNNIDKKAKHVKETWGKHVDILLFMSSEKNESLPAIGLGTGEGRDKLTAKTWKAFQYVYDHYLDKADWFMKADDDTYVFIENLYFFLLDKDPNQSIWYGQPIPREKPFYFSGGAGYVLSKEALRRFGQKQKERCRPQSSIEDLEMGKCMKELGVQLGDTFDHQGRSRFLSQPVERYIFGDLKVRQISSTILHFLMFVTTLSYVYTMILL